MAGSGCRPVTSHVLGSPSKDYSFHVHELVFTLEVANISPRQTRPLKTLKGHQSREQVTTDIDGLDAKGPPGPAPASARGPPGRMSVPGAEDGLRQEPVMENA